MHINMNIKMNINNLLSRVYSLILQTYMHRLEINIFRTFWPNILWYWQNSQWVNSIFPNGKCLFQFIHKFLKL